MRKLLKKQGVTPATIVTDKLGSYSSALRESAMSRSVLDRASMRLRSWPPSIFADGR